MSANPFARSITGVIWNFEQNRIRGLWRILITVLGTAALTFVFGIPFYAVGGGEPSPTINKLLLYFAAAVVIRLATQVLDKRPFSNTGIYLKFDWWANLGFGVLLGAALMTIVFLVELAAGWITIEEVFRVEYVGQPFLLAILLPFFLMLIVGIVEELAFRGYLLLNLAEALNLQDIGARRALVIAWLLTSILFGVAHAFLPNATVVSSVNIVLAGIWLGLAYVLTGSLATSIGIHFAWNFFQGYIFGFPVSGSRDFATTLIAIDEQGGQEIWTGGAFGPEGGLIGLLAMVLGILLVMTWIRLRYGRLTLFTAIAVSPLELGESIRQVLKQSARLSTG